MRRNDALNAALAEAEQNRRCLWGTTNAMQKVLARHEHGGDIIKVYPRLYVRRTSWEELSVFEQQRRILRTLQQLHPRWVFCGMSAALMHGINDSKRHLKNIEIITSERSHVRDYGIVRHCYLRDPLIEIVDDVRVTSLARTVFDCARKHDFPDALAVIDATLRTGSASKAFLTERFMRLPGTRRRKALNALRFAEGKTENGGEAYTYGCILEMGYLKPVLQESFVDPLEPLRSIRPDFLWRFDGKLIAGELDGRQKYHNPSLYINGSLPDTVIHEKEREERLRMICTDVVRFSFGEVMERRPLAAKLDAAGIPRRAQ